MDRELEKWALQQQLTADRTAQESDDEQKAIRDNKMGVNEKRGRRIANYTFTRVGYRSVRTV
jgi:hypothetical protein